MSCAKRSFGNSEQLSNVRTMFVDYGALAGDSSASNWLEVDMQRIQGPEITRKVPLGPMMPGWSPEKPVLEDRDDTEIGEKPSGQIIRDIRRIIRENPEPGEQSDIDPRHEPGKSIN